MVVARIIALLMISGIPLAAARPCAAQDVDARAEAARLFKTGDADFAAGHYGDAAGAFERSNRLVPRAAAVYSAARAWDAAGAIDRAADDYDEALSRTDLHGAEADDARRRLGELEPRLGVVSVRAPEDARVWVGHVDGALGSVRSHVAPGDYDVRVERAGDRPWLKHVHVAGGESTALSAELVAAAPVVVEEKPAGAPAAAPRNRVPMWIALGVAAAGAIASGVLYAETVHARDAFDGSGDHDPHLRDAATNWRTATYVGYAFTGAALAAGATFYFVW